MDNRYIFPDVRINYGTEYGDEVVYLKTDIRKKFGRYYYLIHVSKSYRTTKRYDVLKVFIQECYNCLVLSKLDKSIKAIDGRELMIKDYNQESEVERVTKKYLQY